MKKKHLKLLWVTHFNSVKQGKDRAHGGAKALIKSLMKKAHVDLETVFQEESSRAAAKALARHAKDEDVDLVLCETHGRSGLARMVKGSFAESLILYSPVPVIVCNPHCQEVKSLIEILFITNFSAQSHDAFLRVLDLARVLGAKVKIFHAMTMRFNPVIESGAGLMGAGWVPLEAYTGAESKEQKRMAETWAAAARKAGVKAEATVAARETSVTSAVERIVRKEHPGIVACAAESTATEAMVFGSVTRDLMRKLSTPIMVARA